MYIYWNETKKALRLCIRGARRRFICTCMNMHLAALPPIYVSGTSRTNFGNNRTGSDRMSTGCPPGILDTVLPLQPEALPAESIPTPPLFFPPLYFSLYSSAKACHPLSLLPSIFHLLFPFVFFFFLFSSSSFIFSIGESREREHIVRNIVQFSYFIGPRTDDNKI